ncbi:MAG: MATE family efflux transporter [Betaproteobacteria bacterium]|nr:MAG: MATE family efflux transporter [Betaproteobacteria bacterium]
MMDPRTRLLLEAPTASTLLRLAIPNMLVMLAQAAAGLVETYFIGKLGTDALAGVALVFPVVMLMQMMSAGAMGGGIASSIARALGAGRRADANALALHALVIALCLGAAFAIGVVGGGRWIYQAMGGSGRALEAALTYSNWIFAGAVLVWLFNSLGAVLRGTGNMAFPAAVTCIGVLILVPASPVLIFGWGPFPALGIAGGAVALLSYYVLGCLAFVAYLWGGRSVLHPSLRTVRFRWPLFRDILRVGAVAALVTVTTNLTIIIGTAFVGAGERERALRTAWIGAAIAFTLTEAIGLCAAAFPTAWLSLFDTDARMLEAGATYLRTVGPFYGMFGLALSLYFASQGAGRLLWPLLGAAARLAIAALAGWLALRWTGELSHVFLAQSLGLVAAGLINWAAVAGGAWFGSLRWPWSTAAALQKQSST